MGLKKDQFLKTLFLKNLRKKNQKAVKTPINLESLIPPSTTYTTVDIQTTSDVQPSTSAAADVQPSTSAATNVQPTAPGTVVILDFGIN